MTNSQYITDGIILKRKPFRESGILCQCLTHDYGMITIIASGIYKENSKFTGLLEPFNFLQLELYKSNKSDIYNLRNAGLITSFIGSLDYDKTIVLNAAAELLLQISYTHDENEYYFELLAKYCQYLIRTEHHPYLVFLRFVFKLFSILGIPLNNRCSLCAAGNRLYYNERHHGFVCRKCADGTEQHSSSMNEPLSQVAERRSSYERVNQALCLSDETSTVISSIYNLGSVDRKQISAMVIDETKQFILNHLDISFHKKFHLNSLKDYEKMLQTP